MLIEVKNLRYYIFHNLMIVMIIVYLIFLFQVKFLKVLLEMDMT